MCVSLTHDPSVCPDDSFWSQSLCVPKTSSKSCDDQAIFADQATDASLSSDPVLTEIDRLG